MPRSSCLPGLPTRRIIQTAPLLFGIANATRRGYILKRAPPDNSLGISSARISSRGYRLVAGGIRMVEGWGGPRFWSAASRKLKKKLVSRFYARLVSYGKLGTTLGFRALPRHDFIILPPSLLCSMGGGGRASMERFAILLSVLVPLFASGEGRGLGYCCGHRFTFSIRCFLSAMCSVVTVEVQRFLEYYTRGGHGNWWVNHGIIGRGVILCKRK